RLRRGFVMVSRRPAIRGFAGSGFAAGGFAVTSIRLGGRRLGGSGVLRLGRLLAADGNRRRRSEVGRRRHRSDVTGVEDVGAGARGTRARRRDITYNRN